MEFHLKTTIDNNISNDINKNVMMMDRCTAKIKELENSGRISPTTPTKGDVCRFWLKGKCTKGSKCRWKHENINKQTHKVYGAKSSSSSSKVSDLQDPNDLDDYEHVINTPYIVIKGKWADVDDDDF